MPTSRIKAIAERWAETLDKGYGHFEATIFGKKVLLDSTTPAVCIRMNGATYMELAFELEKNAKSITLDEHVG